MKKLIAMILSVLLVFSLAACGNRTEEQSGSAGTSQTGEASIGNKGKVLVAYFTLPEAGGVDTVAGASRVAVGGEVLGNTQYIAQLIQEEAGGDLFAIETEQQYPLDHDPLVDQADEEQGEEARPELSSKIEDPDQYDTIILGYPNWWGDMPMPLYTFLEEYDFSGKTIVPFTTHGGSGLSGTISTIGELQPDATVIGDGLSISRDSVPEAQGDVQEWVSGLGLAGQ